MCQTLCRTFYRCLFNSRRQVLSLAPFNIMRKQTQKSFRNLSGHALFPKSYPYFLSMDRLIVKVVSRCFSSPPIALAIQEEACVYRYHSR